MDVKGRRVYGADSSVRLTFASRIIRSRRGEVLYIAGEVGAVRTYVVVVDGSVVFR